MFCNQNKNINNLTIEISHLNKYLWINESCGILGKISKLIVSNCINQRNNSSSQSQISQYSININIYVTVNLYASKAVGFKDYYSVEDAKNLVEKTKKGKDNEK